MTDIYENRAILNEYLLFHYGNTDDILSPSVMWPSGMIEALDFAVRTTSHFSDDKVNRGLDLGCAVGRSSFEMSRSCEAVIGIDYSHSFIDAANNIRENLSLKYSRLDESFEFTDLVAKLPFGIDPERVVFNQGDAMNLPMELGSFDRVHAANLLCRLSDPIKLLERLPSLVNCGGELVLTTPCTWLEQFTPQKNWPCGGTLEWMQGTLSPYFDLNLCIDESFLIRETARKFQWTRSMLTRWRRI